MCQPALKSQWNLNQQKQVCTPLWKEFGKRRSLTTLVSRNVCRTLLVTCPRFLLQAWRTLLLVGLDQNHIIAALFHVEVLDVRVFPWQRTCESVHHSAMTVKDFPQLLSSCPLSLHKKESKWTITIKFDMSLCFKDLFFFLILCLMVSFHDEMTISQTCLLRWLPPKTLSFSINQHVCRAAWNPQP